VSSARIEPKVGDRRTYQERPRTEGWPVLPVEILKFGPPRSNKAPVRFLEGEYARIDLWAPGVRLQTPWGEAEAWQEDARRFAAVRRASLEALGSVDCAAAFKVFDAYPRAGEIEVGFGTSEGASIRVANLAEVAVDLEIEAGDLLREPLAYVDRHGVYVARGR
jgi:hypothetical protein